MKNRPILSFLIGVAALCLLLSALAACVTGSFSFLLPAWFISTLFFYGVGGVFWFLDQAGF